MDSQKQERLLRLKNVLKRYPVARATWYAGIRAGKFPRPVKLSDRCSAWRESDIDRLIAQASEVQP
jgi:prophage regulatory protein